MNQRKVVYNFNGLTIDEKYFYRIFDNMKTNNKNLREEFF